MLRSFRLRLPDWIIFGPDSVRQVGQEARRLDAGRVMVLCGPRVAKAGPLERVLDSLKEQKLEVEVFDRVEEEPSTSNVTEAAGLAREGRFDVFIGLGGGSCLDMTKMVAALMTNEGQVSDYFGVDLVPQPGRPSIMIPTTSGTGSEVTRIAVFTDGETKMKRVISAQTLLPTLALVDPSLARTMPPRVTTATGIDAFIHALESYLALGANPVTDNLALEAISLIAQSLGPAFANGEDTTARYNMSLASLLAGVTLNNAGVGVMHALSFPIARDCHLVHGLALVVILGATMRALAVANLPKLRDVAEAMGGDTTGLSPLEAAEVAIEGMVELAGMVGLPTSLRDIKADRGRIEAWAKAAHGNQRLLDNTPRRLSLEDIIALLEDAF